MFFVYTYSCEDKRHLTAKLLPKKPTRMLKNSLEKLNEKLDDLQRTYKATSNKSIQESNIDRDFLMKRKEVYVFFIWKSFHFKNILITFNYYIELNILKNEILFLCICLA